MEAKNANDKFTKCYSGYLIDLFEKISRELQGLLKVRIKGENSTWAGAIAALSSPQVKQSLNRFFYKFSSWSKLCLS